MRISKILILIIVITVIIVGSYVMYEPDKTINYIPEGNLISDDKTITDQDDILKYAEEYDLDDVDKIRFLKIVDYDFEITNKYEEPKSTIIDIIYGSEYYIKEDSISEPIKMKGNLLYSYLHEAPHSININTSISNEISTSNDFYFKLSDTIFMDNLGYSLFYAFPFKVDYQLNLISGERVEVQLFSIVERSSFEVWEDDIFHDDEIGNFRSDKPVGILLAFYNC